MTATHELVLILLTTAQAFRRIYALTQLLNYRLLFPDLSAILKDLAAQGLIVIQSRPEGNYYEPTSAACDYCRKLNVETIWMSLDLAEDGLLNVLQDKVQQL